MKKQQTPGASGQLHGRDLQGWELGLSNAGEFKIK